MWSFETGSLIAEGNTRAREIIKESGVRETFEQARGTLAQYYPATLEEKEVDANPSKGMAKGITVLA